MSDQVSGQSFQCPSCGAPVLPKGSQAVVSCPYCHTTVIVPETLRQSAEPVARTTTVLETFANNDNGWQLGVEKSRFFTSLERAVREGRYRWDAQRGPDSSTTTAFLPAYHVADFDVQVNAKHIVGSKTGSSWGVVFRGQDYLNYYVCRVTDNQLFTLACVEQGKWRVLVDWTSARAIKPYGVNQLGVLGRGAHFVCSINGEVAAEVDDDRFGRGYVGLALETYIPGERTIVDFLDVELRPL